MHLVFLGRTDLVIRLTSNPVSFCTGTQHLLRLSELVGPPPPRRCDSKYSSSPTPTCWVARCSCILRALSGTCLLHIRQANVCIPGGTVTGWMC